MQGPQPAGEQRMELCQAKDISEFAVQADKTQYPKKTDLQQGEEKPPINSTDGNIPLLLQNLNISLSYVEKARES